MHWMHGVFGFKLKWMRGQRMKYFFWTSYSNILFQTSWCSKVLVILNTPCVRSTRVFACLGNVFGACLHIERKIHNFPRSVVCWASGAFAVNICVLTGPRVPKYPTNTHFHIFWAWECLGEALGRPGRDRGGPWGSLGGASGHPWLRGLEGVLGGLGGAWGALGGPFGWPGRGGNSNLGRFLYVLHNSKLRFDPSDILRIEFPVDCTNRSLPNIGIQLFCKKKIIWLFLFRCECVCVCVWSVLSKLISKYSVIVGRHVWTLVQLSSTANVSDNFNSKHEAFSWIWLNLAKFNLDYPKYNWISVHAQEAGDSHLAKSIDFIIIEHI